MRLALVTLLLIGGCATTKAAEPKRTLPSPLVAAKLPDRPDAEPIAPSADWSVSCAGYLAEKGDQEPELVKKPGICMSTEKAIRAARYVVGYNELRGLYVVDLRTWGRERQIYERHLNAADDEIVRWKERARRSFWEQYSGQIGLGAGIVVGAVVTITIMYAVKQVKE